MKKLFSVLLATASVFSVGVCATACGSARTYEGIYRYENVWAKGTYYGAKVSVTVKDGVVQEVVLHADTEEMTNYTAWNWSLSEDAKANTPAMLDKFKGMTVADVMKIEVMTEKGEPTSVSDENFVIMTGATVSSGRLILAVQNALEDYLDTKEA